MPKISNRTKYNGKQRTTKYIPQVIAFITFYSTILTKLPKPLTELLCGCIIRRYGGEKMKFFKIYLILTLVIVLLIPACTHSKKRDLSTPLSRLVGHWQDRQGFEYYFTPVDHPTMTGSLIYKIPEEEKLMMFSKAILEAYASEMLEQGGYKNKQEAKEWIEIQLNSYAEKKTTKNLAGRATYHPYKVLPQVPSDKKIKIFIFWYGDNLLVAPEVTTFHIKKNGKRMLINEECGKFVNPLRYVDGKPSPVDK
jgi:hypothetical protein